MEEKKTQRQDEKMKRGKKIWKGYQGMMQEGTEELKKKNEQRFKKRKGILQKNDDKKKKDSSRNRMEQCKDNKKREGKMIISNISEIDQ